MSEPVAPVDLARRIPKAELHLHVEGTLEPELMFSLAARNGVDLPYPDVEAVRDAYRFTDLQSFLDIYYRAASVLRTADDFHDLMTEYLRRAVADGVRHAEVFFDPQAHTARGVGFETFMPGLVAALEDAERRDGITGGLILCFLRHLGAEDAVATLRAAEPHLDRVIAVGLDSTEVGYPPELFVEPFAMARELGLHAVAHAAEEGPPSYITGALDALGVERIDHGVRCEQDEAVVERLVRDRIPLTVCPLSNVALRGVEKLEDHNLARLLRRGLKVSINSDDPAYFGGYIAENYAATTAALGLTSDEVTQIARNSVESSFLSDDRRQSLVAEIEAAR